MLGWDKLFRIILPRLDLKNATIKDPNFRIILRIRRYMLACFVLMIYRLRLYPEDTDLQELVESRLLSEKERERVVKAQNLRAQVVILMIYEQIASLCKNNNWDTITRVAMEDRCDVAADSFLGGVRNVGNPLPFPFTRLTYLMIIVWCSAVNLTLVSDFGWFLIIPSAFLAYVFFGLYSIGIEIENPFGESYTAVPLVGLLFLTDIDVTNLIVAAEPAEKVEQLLCEPAKDMPNSLKDILRGVLD